MVERLFVYGTLGPGQPNAHVLSAIGGSWEPASVTGMLSWEGWGAAMGFPGINLNDQGEEGEGFLFISENLTGHWASLDEFEGEEYERAPVKVKCKDTGTVDAFIYVLRAR